MADKIEKTAEPTQNAARPHAAITQPEPAQHTHDTTAPAAKLVERKPSPPLDERYFEQAEYKQTRWYALINRGVPIEDVLAPGFWAYVARDKLRPGNKIGCFWEDRSLYLELIVFETGLNWASVGLFRNGVATPPPGMAGKSAGTDFEIKNLGEIKRWSVIRRDDGREVSVGHSTQDMAQRFLSEYLKSLVGQRAA